jgi:hypothetical protein
VRRQDQFAKIELWEIKASQQRVFYVVVMGGEMVLLNAAKKEWQGCRTLERQARKRRNGSRSSG